MVEPAICNRVVKGSIPFAGSISFSGTSYPGDDKGPRGGNPHHCGRASRLEPEAEAADPEDQQDQDQEEDKGLVEPATAEETAHACPSFQLAL